MRSSCSSPAHGDTYGTHRGSASFSLAAVQQAQPGAQPHASLWPSASVIPPMGTAQQLSPATPRGPP